MIDNGLVKYLSEINYALFLRDTYAKIINFPRLVNFFATELIKLGPIS